MGERRPRHKEVMAALEKEQARVIAEIRSHLTAEENAQVTDKLIWQRGVKFGPDTPEGHAEKLKAALRAAGEYGDALAGELGLSDA